MHLAVGLGAAFVLLGTGAAPAPASSPKTLVQLRVEVQPLVAARCGKCHSSSSPKAIPGAVAVFDADRPDWSAGLSKARLPIVLQRFKGAPPADIERVTVLIEAELAAR